MSPEDAPISQLIRDQATRHPAPDSLRAAVLTQVALAEAARPRLRARGWRGTWRPALAGFALGVAGGALVLPLTQRAWLTEPMEVSLVADHVRALQAGPLTEVASSDRHTVKPWFQGRLDYAPPVFDLAGDGFPLLGGRVDRVGGRPVAALVYTRHRHVIEVFVWPDESRSPARPLRQRGFNLVQWSDGAMAVWAVSDMDAAELARFATLWQARSATP